MWIDALEATIDKDRIGTHWADCYLQHKDCAILRLIAVARAGRKLAYAGELVRDYGGQVAARATNWGMLYAALAGFREAEGG